MRISLFEFEDLSWFPDSLRKGGTDYLRYFLNKTSFYEPVIPLLEDLVHQTGERVIFDLCSGGGGAIQEIASKMNDQQVKLKFILSDKFPNADAFQHITANSHGNIGFVSQPVDATAVGAQHNGIRTVFSAIHHFDPVIVKQIIQNAVDAKAPIAIFDGGDKNLLTILGIILFHPFGFFFGTPFFRPFKWSRLFFTYIIPLIPITTIWDGCVSILRLHSPGTLLKLAQSTAGAAYHWRAGKVKNKLGMHVTYLTGYPVEQ